MEPRTITILSLIDVVGALASDSMQKNLYLFDDNKSNGSTNLGTGVLKTKVQAGDKLIWTLMALEPEAYAQLYKIEMDSTVCKLEQKKYPQSDVIYWEGHVLKEVTSTPYKITFEVGTQKQQIETLDLPSLIG
ncbi:hypothetical protein HNQ91_001691 [Filimonas zeae]|uniref:Uncharacterized protein n=1 Tax=Filimonas zeae TaxID=1737353 RepID=A0A917IX61_9BACT|nr:hypothetical protein [Filimonas zeae]MDR6338640.1 hypothetical protein [Filimonas zeae]GGH67267.1 hypothetical protein GCM10011379_22360 [Filimonas zeae]